MHQHEKPKHTPQLTRFQAKYHTLQNRLERAIRSGRFFRYSLHRQQQLLRRLQRYAQRLLRWGKLTTGTALVGTSLLVSEPLQGQMFTEVTGTASPFVLKTPLFTDIGSNSAPTFADLDGDGDLDLFSGEDSGNIYYFENTSTESSIPAFSDPIQNPFGLYDVAKFDSTPTFEDIDNDGDLDAFVGEFYGNIFYFENTSTDSSIPAFSLSSSSEPFGLSDVEFGSKPTFADLDGDGNIDAFVGEIGGNINYFENTSTDSSIPAFSLSSSSEPFGLTDVIIRSSPTFADLDSDLDLDAFVGDSLGNINYFENISTNSSLPAFTSPIQNPFGLTDVGCDANPSFADLDNDGDLDAFVGERDGNILYFKNTSTNSYPPAFDDPVKNAFNFSNIGLFSIPTFVDLDSDGDLDAFVGESNGNVFYFENTSTDSSIPAFILPIQNPFGLSDVGRHSAPIFIDLDGDGDFDGLLGESDGNINYFENTSTNSSIPSFRLSNSSEPFGLFDVGFICYPAFADLDSDSDLDAFVGESDGSINYFENVGDSQNPTFILITNPDPFGLPDVGDYSKPVLVDLDGDGLFEAIIGERDGTLNYFESNILVPVELTTFLAKAHNKHILLHWQTASETNNKGFHIERSSTGKDWKTIGFVHGQGTTVEAQNYHFNDEQPFFGTNYYRLRQVDFDGSKHYSDIVQVSLKTTEVKLSPNPVNDILQITNGEGRAIIYDLSGKAVKMALITDVQATLQVQDLPQGQYVLTITRADGTVLSERFVE